MINKEQVRSQVLQYFQKVGSGENIVQAIKQALFLNEQFNPLLLFQLISLGKQKITKNDWRHYLTKIKVAYSQKQIRYFFRHNHFKQEINFNQFMEAIMPYNSDVIREYKAKYIQSLQIQEMSRQIQFIFAELMISWMSFFKTLVNIRTELSQAVTRKQIQNLIKQDLVLQSKPRQSRKFNQSFQLSNFQLSFHQLRKFLQIWISPDNLMYQFCLLNIKRHLKCSNPFQKIVYRRHKKGGSKSRCNSRSVSARKSKLRTMSESMSMSRSISKSKSQTNKNTIQSGSKKTLQSGNKRTIQLSTGPSYKNKQTMKKSINNQQEREQRQISSHKYTDNNSKYDEYKRALKQNFQKETNDYSQVSDLRLQNQKKQSKKRVIFNFGNQKAQNENQKQFGTYQRQLIVKLLQQIVLKQDRLQKLRKQLAKSDEFSIHGLFKLIDSQNRGFINSRSLQEFTNDPSRNFKYFINFYAKQGDKLSLSQFYTIFRPLSKQLNEQLDKRPQQKPTIPYKKETMRLIIQILRLQAEMHHNIGLLGAKIKQQRLNIKSVFGIIDTNNKGYVKAQDIKQLLQQNNINCQPKDLKCLMKLFYKRIDEEISLREFLNFLDF